MEEQREREILEIRSGFNAVAYSIGIALLYLVITDGLGPIYGKTILSVLFIVLIIRKQKKSVELGIENFFTIERVSPVDLLKSAVLILGIFGITVLCTSILFGGSAGNGSGSLTPMIVSSVLSPVSEELGFRALIQGRLSQAMGPISAIIIQAIPFWFGHGISLVTIYTFIIGIVLGVTYKKTGNIFIPMFQHSLTNSIKYIMIIVPWEYILTVIYICIIPAIIIFIKWIREIKESSL